MHFQFILKINYSWKIKISSYGIVLTFMLHAQILLKQQFQPRQSHWCQAQIGLIFSPLICIYVELWNMLVKGWVQKNDFSTWRIVSYAWSLSTSYYLLILKWKKLKRYCFLVEKVLLFIKKYCRKKVLSKGIRPLDTVLIWSGGYPIHVSVHKILRQYILAVGLVEMVVADLVRVHTWRHLQPHSPVIQLHLHS